MHHNVQLQCITMYYNCLPITIHYKGITITHSLQCTTIAYLLQCITIINRIQLQRKKCLSWILLNILWHTNNGINNNY